MTQDQSKAKAKRQRDNWKRRALEWRETAWQLYIALTDTNRMTAVELFRATEAKDAQELDK